MSNLQSFNLDGISASDMQKGFALACRFIADNTECPGVYSNINFPECTEENPSNCEDMKRLKCWQGFFLYRVQNEPVCRVCGCTENNACPGGCWWAEDDLCSACAEKQKRVKHHGK